MLCFGYAWVSTIVMFVVCFVNQFKYSMRVLINLILQVLELQLRVVLQDMTLRMVISQDGGK